MRQRALRTREGSRQERFVWLTPPDGAGRVTVLDIVQAPTPTARTEQLRQYIPSVWEAWAAMHEPTIADWYTRFVLPDRL